MGTSGERAEREIVRGERATRRRRRREGEPGGGDCGGRGWLGRDGERGGGEGRRGKEVKMKVRTVRGEHSLTGNSKTPDGAAHPLSPGPFPGIHFPATSPVPGTSDAQSHPATSRPSANFPPAPPKSGRLPPCNQDTGRRPSPNNGLRCNRTLPPSGLMVSHRLGAPGCHVLSDDDLITRCTASTPVTHGLSFAPRPHRRPILALA